jgi:lipopolysaccharide export LptBFGC system permease protein LptF
MLLLNLVLTLVAAYFTREEYNKGRIGWAIFWAILLGWDIHTLIYTL